ncbi:MAG: hypothetical protein AB7S26_19525 [Sandaracinaceae bacterium]
MLPATLSLLCVAGARAMAQDRATLEARLEERPDDTGLLCQVGWARFQDGASPAAAAELLDRATAVLGAPRTPATIVRCSYPRRGGAHLSPATG